MICWKIRLLYLFILVDLINKTVVTIHRYAPFLKRKRCKSCYLCATVDHAVVGEEFPLFTLTSWLHAVLRLQLTCWDKIKQITKHNMSTQQFLFGSEFYKLLFSFIVLCWKFTYFVYFCYIQNISLKTIFV